jgi:hypothetical protein
MEQMLFISYLRKNRKYTMLNWREKRGSAVASSHGKCEHTSCDAGDGSGNGSGIDNRNIRHIDAQIQLNVYSRLDNIYRSMYMPIGHSNRFGKWIHDCSEEVYSK